MDRHPRSSAFHTAAWLEALHRTYGYEPVAYTTSPPGETLKDGLVFCDVSSWLTGRRLISLPFSDHCEPLIDDCADGNLFVSAIRRNLDRETIRYVEIRSERPLPPGAGLYQSTNTCRFHRLDLRPNLATLFGNCHRSSTQRKILRAQREGLVCESGRSQALLDAFRGLLLMTRRRHRVPPQPGSWFRNLIDCFGEALQIRVAFKDKRPVAAIVTLQHKDTLVYKYGCSDTRFNNLGGTHLLFWNAIQEAKRSGLRALDLGRTDCDNSGLITFKDRWGSSRSSLVYSRFSVSPPPGGFARTAIAWAGRISRGCIPCVPDRILNLIGGIAYRHVA